MNYPEMQIIDLHCDTVLRCMSSGDGLAARSGHVNLKKLREGGCLAQCFALFVPTHDAAREEGIETAPYQTYQNLLATYRRLLDECRDDLRPALSAEDIAKNRADGYLSAILTLEDMAHVEGRLERIDELAEDGVRIASLTWNYENCVGYPNSPDPALHARGLKPFGFEALERMNARGVLVDVSHLSEGGFWDVARSAARSGKPFVATHSCARALCAHQRNLTDAQLRAVADCGGVVGLNFCPAFLRDGAADNAVEDVVRHAVHIRNVAGEDALAWGSDFDGIDGSLTYADFPRILAALAPHFTPRQLDKLNHANFLRVFAAG